MDNDQRVSTHNNDIWNNMGYAIRTGLKATIKTSDRGNLANVPVICITKTQYCYVEKDQATWANLEDVVDVYFKEAPAKRQVPKDFSGLLT